MKKLTKAKKISAIKAIRAFLTPENQHLIEDGELISICKILGNSKITDLDVLYKTKK